jgi:hypothetical protein
MKDSYAYLAGFFDGEGCVSFHTYKRPDGWLYNFNLSVDNLALRPLQMFAEAFGGTVRKYSASHKRHDVWRWRISGLEAQAALQMMHPYLTVKGKQSAVALKIRLYKRRGRIKLTSHDHHSRKTAIATLRKLKQVA